MSLPRMVFVGPTECDLGRDRRTQVALQFWNDLTTTPSFTEVYQKENRKLGNFAAHYGAVRDRGLSSTAERPVTLWLSDSSFIFRTR